MSNKINGYIQNTEETLKRNCLDKFNLPCFDSETISLLHRIQVFPDKQEEKSAAQKLDIKDNMRVEGLNNKEEILTKIYKIVDNKRK